MANPPPPGGQPAATSQLAPPSYTSLLDELNVQAKQRELRKELIHAIEKLETETSRKKGQTTAFVAYIAQENVAGSGLSTNDIPIFGNVLLKMGDVDSLSLLL
jgi:hypothetical protein